MKYFAVYLPMKDEAKSKEIRQEHLDFVLEMDKQGHIFTYGRLTDGTGGLIIFQGESLEAVTEIAKQDPYVSAGARGFSIHEWDMKSSYHFSK